MRYAIVSVFKRPGEFDQPLTYRIPASLSHECRVGCGVEVTLRGKKARGIIISLEDALSENIGNIQELQSFPESLVLSPEAVALARDISDYYCCSLLRALRLFVPKFLWEGKGKRVLSRVEKNPYEAADTGIFPLAPFRHELTAQQKSALEQISGTDKPVLLQGVTASGKTEIYLRLILDQIKRGKQAVLLVPEIAITPQMISYFKRYFGHYMALFHSRLSDGERLQEWLKVKSGYAPLAIGSRSAIFAPVRDLGIVIVDEEHEWTYKQESSPYYETHRVAEMMRERTGCRIVFGSATPRMETFYRARQGDFEHVLLKDRINDSALPVIKVVDLREEFRKKNFSIFSEALRSRIADRLKKKEQVILFVNQRGMARAVVCRDCGEAMKCPHCEVSLKLHGGSYGSTQYLLCHYCAYKTEPRLSCPHCQSPNIRHAGLGTEKVEEELFKAFPQARVVRADKDTTSDKLGFEPIYEAFKKGQYDILVGTQMVAKGLDFPDVTLIGIMLADIGLHIPDFRSHERLFQLITQVAGRAGRGDSPGEVILQTYQPEHHAIRMAADYAFEVFAEQELAFRKRLNYPPYRSLIKFVVTGMDKEGLERQIGQEIELLEDIFKVNAFLMSVSAAPAMVSKIGPNHYYNVLLRGEDLQHLFRHWKIPKNWRADIDPVHTA